MNQHVHIVCFDAPSPPDYGGAIDLFYEIKSLAAIGKEITLHYFNYHRDRNIDGLEKDCFAFYAYRRQTGLTGMLFFKPFIVSSRINKQLIKKLNEDNNPIILGGVHCCGIVPYLKGNNRKIIIRIQNDEAGYYRRLAKHESRTFHKIYYAIEGRLLEAYQKKLPQFCDYACLSEADVAFYSKKLGLKNVHFIPTFIPWRFTQPVKEKGSYCLYHGNLSVSENKKAVEWLITNVFSKLQVPFTIAGKNIPHQLHEKISAYSHITLIKNPRDEQLLLLIQNAQINVLPSFNKTGVKLKLLHAFFEGKYCITNRAGIEGSGITQGVTVCETAEEFIKAISELYNKEFGQEEINQRLPFSEVYDNKKNAQKLNELL